MRADQPASPAPWLPGIELRERDPGDLLAIPVADRGWAYAGDLTRLYRAWVGPPAGRLDATTLDRLDGLFAPPSTWNPSLLAPGLACRVTRDNARNPG